MRQALLDWYDRSHRVLPWRRNAHSKRRAPAAGEPQPAPADLPRGVFAYHVWVCEACPGTTTCRARLSSSYFLACCLSVGVPLEPFA